jgi:hypothetical protein
MRFLVDAVFPASLAADAPAGVEFIRWSRGDDGDEVLVEVAAREGFRAVVFFERNSLSQPGLLDLAVRLGVGVIAVEASDPVQAKERLLTNFDKLRHSLSASHAVLVLAAEARPVAQTTEG